VTTLFVLGAGASKPYGFPLGNELREWAIKSIKTVFSSSSYLQGADISEEELDKIRDELKKHVIEWDLRREVSQNIKRLQEINSYRGIRHKKHLPVRWQRTKTNSRTRKWKAVSIANKKK